MEKKVLVIGSLNMDLVIHMDKMPEKGETVLGKSLAYVPGGKAPIRHVRWENWAQKLPCWAVWDRMFLEKPSWKI